VRDLSLHILDLIENSIRAGASRVAVTIEKDQAADVMKVIVEDNGPGLSVPADVAMNPFYTTKKGKRTGLGLSFLQTSAGQAGGEVRLRKSRLGGLCVEAIMKLSHVDRPPLGDVAATMSSITCTNPDLEIAFTCRACGREAVLRVPELLDDRATSACRGLAAARQVSERIKGMLADFEPAG